MLRNIFFVSFAIFLSANLKANSNTLLVSPQGEISDNTPTFNWISEANIETYQIGYADLSGTWRAPIISAADAGCPSGSAGQPCSYTLPLTTFDVGSYTWYVNTTLGDDAGYSEGMDFSINTPSSNSSSTQLYPNGTISNVTPTYTWRAVGDNTAYLVGVTTNSGWKEYLVTASDAGCPRDQQLCSYTHLSSEPALPEGSNAWHIGVGGSFGADDMEMPFNINTNINNRYVSAVNGSDNNDGSEGAPWRTIQKAIDEIKQLPSTEPKTLYVNEGIYKEDVIVSGINHLTIKGQRGLSGEYLAIIDGENNSPFDNAKLNRGIISALDVSNFLIEGIKVRNTKKHGIHIRNTTYIDNQNYESMKNINVLDNATEKTSGSGIFIEGDQEDSNILNLHTENHFVIENVIVKGNTVIDPQLSVWDSSITRLWQEDVTLTGGIDGFQINENIVDSSGVSGWNTKSDGGPIGIDVKYGVVNGTIYKNTVQNIPSTGIYVDSWSRREGGAENIDIYQNLVKNVMMSGIHIAAEAGGTVGIVKPIKVYNNVVHHDDESAIGYFGSALSCDNNVSKNGYDAQRAKYVDFSYNTVIGTNLGLWIDSPLCNVNVKNTIISKTVSFGISTWGVANDIVKIEDTCFNETGTTLDEDTYFGPRGNSFVEDVPVFNNLATGDYQLTASSGCVGKGIQSNISVGLPN